MSVFICDKQRLQFSIIFKIFTSMNSRNGSFLKPYNKLAFRILSCIKHSANRLVSLYLIKHSWSFIIQYIKLVITLITKTKMVRKLVSESFSRHFNCSVNEIGIVPEVNKRRCFKIAAKIDSV